MNLTTMYLFAFMLASCILQCNSNHTIYDINMSDFRQSKEPTPTPCEKNIHKLNVQDNISSDYYIYDCMVIFCYVH